jgi:hypothetical protein
VQRLLCHISYTARGAEKEKEREEARADCLLSINHAAPLFTPSDIQFSFRSSLYAFNNNNKKKVPAGWLGWLHQVRALGM